MYVSMTLNGYVCIFFSVKNVLNISQHGHFNNNLNYLAVSPFAIALFYKYEQFHKIATGQNWAFERSIDN